MKIGGWSALSVLERYLRRNQKNFILAVQSLDSIAGIVKRVFSRQSWHRLHRFENTKDSKNGKTLWISIDAKILKNKNYICKTSYS